MPNTKQPEQNAKYQNATMSSNNSKTKPKMSSKKIVNESNKQNKDFKCESCIQFGKGTCNAFKCIARNYCDWKKIVKPKHVKYELNTCKHLTCKDKLGEDFSKFLESEGYEVVTVKDVEKDIKRVHKDNNLSLIPKKELSRQNKDKLNKWAKVAAKMNHEIEYPPSKDKLGFKQKLIIQISELQEEPTRQGVIQIIEKL